MHELAAIRRDGQIKNPLGVRLISKIYVDKKGSSRVDHIEHFRDGGEKQEAPRSHVAAILYWRGV